MKVLQSIVVLSLATLLSACGGGVSQVVPSNGSSSSISPDDQEGMNGINRGNGGANTPKSGVEIIGATDGSTLDGGSFDGQTLTDEQRRALELAAQEFKPVVYFSYDQSGIDEKNMATIVHYAEYLNQNIAEKITLTGHTDARGTPEYNLALGEKRAKSVKEVFMLYGVNDSRISLITMGEEMPAVDEQNDEAWAQNRRVEFSITE